MSTSFIGVIIGLIAVAIIAALFFWYQFRRARESFKHIDHSKLRDWDNDGWDDDWNKDKRGGNRK